jgi:hypothetical protein
VRGAVARSLKGVANVLNGREAERASKRAHEVDIWTGAVPARLEALRRHVLKRLLLPVSSARRVKGMGRFFLREVGPVSVRGGGGGTIRGRDIGTARACVAMQKAGVAGQHTVPAATT